MKFSLLGKSKKLIVLTFSLIILLAAVTSYYFYQYQKTQQLLKNPTSAAQEEIKTLLVRVGKLIILPQEEQPTIAMVSDKNKLKDQAFFAKAENGDKVLIYTNARKAILYRPSINRIIDVAPVNLGSQSNSNLPTSTPSPIEKKIAIYNGTLTTGLTNVVEKELREEMKEISIVAKENTSKKGYDKTFVIDLTGGNEKETTQKIAKIIGGEASASLPQGEIKPSADILIIAGADYAKKK